MLCPAYCFLWQVLALVLLGISAATIGVIENNKIFDVLRNYDGELDDAGQELLDLILRSLAAAGWLILLGGAVVIAEIIAIVLLIANFDALKLVLGILVSFIYFFIILYIINPRARMRSEGLL